MSSKTSIQLLQEIDEKVNELEEKIDNVYVLEKSIAESVNELRQHAARIEIETAKTSLVNTAGLQWADDEISGSWSTRGLTAHVGREFIDKYIPSIKWFVFASGAYALGWLSKIAHAWLSK